jgi:thymidylate kinase
VTARIAIIDGVTGAGKTTVIGLLASRFRDGPNRRDVIVIDEDKTLGAIMEQVRDPAWCANPTFEAVESTIAQLEAAALSTPLRPG